MQERLERTRLRATPTSRRHRGQHTRQRNPVTGVELWSAPSPRHLNGAASRDVRSADHVQALAVQPLDAAQRAFDLSTCPPAPLAFDRPGFAELPPWLLPLDELKKILIAERTPGRSGTPCGGRWWYGAAGMDQPPCLSAGAVHVASPQMQASESALHLRRLAGAQRSPRTTWFGDGQLADRSSPPAAMCFGGERSTCNSSSRAGCSAAPLRRSSSSMSSWRGWPKARR
jgi:hypothetical protein